MIYCLTTIFGKALRMLLETLQVMADDTILSQTLQHQEIRKKL